MFPNRKKTISLLGAFALITVQIQTLHSQAGDAKDESGETQDAIWKNLEVPPAPILTPEQAMLSFSVEPGFKLELVASEPLVNDPVAIAWDEFGRIWVAEMWAYMPDADGHGEDQPVSRVVILEDTDEDGQMDRSTVFLDKLVMPRAISFVKGGALIADPPNLYFCEDTNGDLVSDKKTIVAEYGAEGNVEHAENGLMRGLDNWLYNAKSSRRFKFKEGRIHEQDTLFRGQWGITQDDYGRLYHNTNSYYLRGDMTPWEDVSRHPGHEPKAGFDYPVAPDRSVFTIRINPGVNRGYREETLSPDHRLRDITAASAPGIARGDRYPEQAKGNAYVPEPAGNVVSRFQLHDEGLGVKAEKQLHPHEKWGPVEFIASTDERFRPVAAATGPDGFMYVVDMYRGILQHKTYLTTFLRKQIIERGLDQPVGLGRIYRVVHESDTDDRSTLKLGNLSAPELVPYLAHENGWVRDTTQRLLVERGPHPEAILQSIRERTAIGSELSRIHALWTLEGLEEIDLDTATRAFEKGSDWVRVHAIRVAGPQLAAARDTQHPLWALVSKNLEQGSLRVRLQLLQSLPLANDPAAELSQIAALREDDLNNEFFIDAAVSALHGQETELLAIALKSEKKDNFSMLLEALSQALFKERNRQAAATYAEQILSPDTPETIKQAIKQGFQQSMEGRNARPLKIAQAPSITPPTDSIVFKAFDWPGKIDPNAVVDYQYTDSDLESISRGKPLYTNTCAICHNANGQGTPSLAPALAGSEWVKSSKERLALIVGQGLIGPIVVNNEQWNAAMPPHGMHPALTGESFNDLLNYIRASWDNNSSPYQDGEARSYLEKHSSRNGPWTVEDLEKSGITPRN